MLHARTPIGQISDFLRAYPSVTYEQYMYKMSVAMITLMSMDFTHEITLNEAQYEFYRKVSAPIIGVNQLERLFGIKK